MVRAHEEAEEVDQKTTHSKATENLDITTYL